ncbi:MAG: alcohol dehydrogenase [Acidiferrobacteraceae bacterium]|nr:alcohol dehydrogenase [Acidiferrobacteraceae bacterium]
MNQDWNYPTRIKFGVGRLEEVAASCQELKITSPMFVVDPGLLQFPMIEQAVSYCRASSLRCEVFAGLKSNPTGKNVKEGVQVFHDGKHDGIVAFGGGSALDAGKAIALLSGQQLPLWAFEDRDDNWRSANAEMIAPIIAIPTTAGTGSEVGRASVIVDESVKEKKIIFHPSMLPSIVILDPLLTLGLPPDLTAATGMDALSHNLEAWCSPAYHPMSDGIAAEGIRLIRIYLQRAVVDGQDVEARSMMLVASTMGATAFQKGLGAMHALAHPIGAIYDLHHGTLNAILMPYVLQANREKISSILERLGMYVGIDHSSFEKFLHWILKLRHDIGIPETLMNLGIDLSRTKEIGEMAFRDPSSLTNPILFSSSDYESIFRNSILGNLDF